MQPVCNAGVDFPRETPIDFRQRRACLTGRVIDENDRRLRIGDARGSLHAGNSVGWFVADDLRGRRPIQVIGGRGESKAAGSFEWKSTQVGNARAEPDGMAGVGGEWIGGKNRDGRSSGVKRDGGGDDLVLPVEQLHCPGVEHARVQGFAEIHYDRCDARNSHRAIGRRNREDSRSGWNRAHIDLSRPDWIRNTHIGRTRVARRGVGRGELRRSDRSNQTVSAIGSGKRHPGLANGAHGHTRRRLSLASACYSHHEPLFGCHSDQHILPGTRDASEAFPRDRLGRTRIARGVAGQTLDRFQAVNAAVRDHARQNEAGVWKRRGELSREPAAFHHTRYGQFKRGGDIGGRHAQTRKAGGIQLLNLGLLACLQCRKRRPEVLFLRAPPLRRWSRTRLP